MKKTLSVLLLIMTVFTTYGQVQKNSLHGKIMDSNNKILPGASAIIVGTKYGVNSNEAGEYLFDQIPTGKLKVQVSFVGFKTITTDFDVQPGQNYLDLTLVNEDIKLRV
jgi:iron complex outermembrane receptor protein